MDEHTENIKTLFAQMAIHEFLLEIIFSEQFASRPGGEQQFEKFSKEFMERIYFGATADKPADTETVSQIEELAIKAAENFLHKTKIRLTERLGFAS